jgi:hypothetical protein
VLSFPSAVLLPVSVYDITRGFDRPGSVDFWVGVVGLFSAVVILGCGLRFAGELWEEEVRSRPPGKPVPKPDPVRLLCPAALVLVHLSGLMTYATTLDGGCLFAAARWVYLL